MTYRFLNFSISLFLFSAIIITNALAAQIYPWPVDADPALTSTFCEFRDGHFHSGIDLKVWGSVGLKCRAIDDGYVTRVKVSPAGYGRAVYLKLRNGQTAVYAHLQGFEKRLEQLIRRIQHEQKSYSVDLWFDEDEALHYKKNEVIAFSGRSGGKHPHVHFEIRDSSERPLNPLLNGYDIPDSYPPTPTAVALTPIGALSTIEGDCQPRIYSRLVEHHDGVFRAGDPIGFSGEAGVSIEAFDRADGAENLLAVYRLELYVNDELRWTTKFDRFAFDDTRQIELERDYSLKRRRAGDFHRLFRLQGNNLEMLSGSGIISSAANKERPIDVKVYLFDVAGNRSITQLTLVSDRIEDDSRLIGGTPFLDFNHRYRGKEEAIAVNQMGGFFRLSGQPGIAGFRIDGNLNYVCLAHPVQGGVSASWIPPEEFDGEFHLEAFDINGDNSTTCDQKFFKYTPGNELKFGTEDGLAQVVVPAGALYESAWLRIIHEPYYVVNGWIESVYSVEPYDKPVADRIYISLARPNMQTEDGWGLYYLDDKYGWTFLDDSLSGKYYTAAALSYERFGLVRDVDKPVVRMMQPANGSTLRTAHPEFSFFVDDSTSGIIPEDLVMTLDGEVVPAEFDKPIHTFSYKAWKALESGSHLLEINAVDRVGNCTRMKYKFQVDL